MTTVRCRAVPTESVHWTTVYLTRGPMELALCVPWADVRAVVSEEASELEGVLIESLIALGQRPAAGVEDRLEVDLGEVGSRHALVRVRTSTGPVVVRVPVDELDA
jgi:hypothetical protein